MSTSIGRILLVAVCAASSVLAEETILFQQDFEDRTPGLKTGGLAAAYVRQGSSRPL